MVESTGIVSVEQNSRVRKERNAAIQNFYLQIKVQMITNSIQAIKGLECR
jgi:hypothetical protein